VADGLRDQRLQYSKRLHDPSEFQRVYDTKAAVHAPLLVVFLRYRGGTVSRLGVSVGSKHGNAVRRNRIKRVFRAAFRLSQDWLPKGMEYVFVPRKGVKEYSTELVLAGLAKARAELEGKAKQARETAERAAVKTKADSAPAKPESRQP
jgi:ribonuclease P protein component